MKIQIIAHPNAKKPRVEKDLLETIHIYVSEPALKGKANQAIVKALASYFNIKKNNIIFLSGVKSRKKFFEIIR